MAVCGLASPSTFTKPRSKWSGSSALEALDLDLDGHTCKAMAGLIAEGQETMSERATDEVMDAALIAASQRIEHYEISGYGTAAHFAERLGHSEAASLLRQTLEEEQLTDTKLNELAINYINQKAE